MTALIAELFPPAVSVFGGSHYGEDWDAAWERELRIGVPRMFDRYFFLGLPEGDVSEAELGGLIEKILVRRPRSLVTYFPPDKVLSRTRVSARSGLAARS